MMLNELTEIYDPFSSLVVPKEDPEIQYQIGLYWFKRDETQKAEPWIRYAAQQGHDEAILLLATGKRKGFFRDDEYHLISLAIDLLEKFVTPMPAQEDIDDIYNLLKEYLHKRLVLSHAECEAA